MYELVKQKNTTFRVIFGLIVLFFITAVLKIALREPTTSLNDDLIKAANNINAHAPVIIDSTTRLDRVNALSGNVFQYNYTLTTLVRTQVDTKVLKKVARESMIQGMMKNPHAAVFSL